MNERWRPRVTVAGVIERDGRYLLVAERQGDRLLLNQPAGHWEMGENLLDAVRREVLEETGWPFTPHHIVGLYRWDAPSGETFLRLAIAGSIDLDAPRGPLDSPIVDTLWLSADDLEQRAHELRSPLVARCIQDHRSGHIHSLALLHDLVHPL